MLVAKYTANASDVVPTFNDGYQYTVNEVESNGIYTVEINSDSDFSSCNFKDKLELLTVEYLKVTSNVQYMTDMFSTCSQLTQLDVSNWDTSKVTNMHAMFANCSKLTQLDVSKWDTSNVQYMDYMFQKCSQLTQLDVSKWDTSKVQYMTDMFQKCSKLHLIIMNNNTYSNINKIIAQLPSRSSDSKGRLVCVGVNDYSQVSTKENWDIRDCFTVKYKYNNKLANNIPTFNSGFDAYTYTDVVEGNTTTRTLKINGCPTKMQFGQYYNASNDNATNKSLSLLEVLDMDVSSLTTCSAMFRKCNNVSKIDTTYFDTSNVTDMNEMFHTCLKLTQLDLSKWDTSNVTNMGGMFNTCSKLTTIGDVSNWDTSNVTVMSYMFAYCSQLTQLDVSKWVTSKVEYMGYMFQNCSQLTQLDLSNWYTSNVTTMGSMFVNCSQLTQLDVSKWVTSKVQI